MQVAAITGRWNKSWADVLLVRRSQEFRSSNSRIAACRVEKTHKLFRQNSETIGLGYHSRWLPCKVLDFAGTDFEEIDLLKLSADMHDRSVKMSGCPIFVYLQDA